MAINNGPLTVVTYDSIFTAIFDVSITFTDPPGENYYDFWITTSDKENLSEATTSYSGFLPVDYALGYDPVLNRQMIDDKLISGQQVTREFSYSFTYSIEKKPTWGFSFPKPEWFTISLRTMPKEVYKFVKQTRKAQLANNDPYAQPFTTYTNVENGLGIFGGYSPSSKTFHYKVEE